MSRVYCYVDGFNLYHAIEALRRPDLKWLNLMALAQSFLEKKDTLCSVTYFTAVMKWNPAKAQRHREYIAALKASGVEVVESKFQKNGKYCNAYNRYCNFYEEKQTDVAFAVRVLSDAQRGICDRVLLMTADSDQIPLVQELRERCPTVSVEILAPPGRLRQARELCGVASGFKEISSGRLGTCRLARNVPDDNGKIVARCPAVYNTVV
jgi:uncharacterized LabA/DUF88 family protein